MSEYHCRYPRNNVMTNIPLDRNLSEKQITNIILT